ADRLATAEPPGTRTGHPVDTALELHRRLPGSRLGLDHGADVRVAGRGQPVYRAVVSAAVPALSRGRHVGDRVYVVWRAVVFPAVHGAIVPAGVDAELCADLDPRDVHR